MRFTPIIAAAILAYGAVADEAQKPLGGEDSSSVEAATSSVDASLPTFTVSSPPCFLSIVAYNHKHQLVPVCAPLRCKQVSIAVQT